MTLDEMKKALVELDGDDWTPEQWNAGLILLAGVEVGPNADKIAGFTGIPRSKCREIGARLRENGVWHGEKIAVDWLDEETGGVAFLCDVNVALGILQRAGAA